MSVHPEGFSCRRCGACCRAYVQVTEQDVLCWAAAFREDILKCVAAEEALIHPVEGTEGPRCPFLRRLPREGIGRDVYVCLIHDVRPEACFRFPISREQAGRVGCKGFPEGG
jgi:Fe-S-cluster containining protein